MPDETFIIVHHHPHPFMPSSPPPSGLPDSAQSALEPTLFRDLAACRWSMEGVWGPTLVNIMTSDRLVSRADLHDASMRTLQLVIGQQGMMRGAQYGGENLEMGGV